MTSTYPLDILEIKYTLELISLWHTGANLWISHQGSSRVQRRFLCLLGVFKAYMNLVSLIFRGSRFPDPPTPPLSRPTHKHLYFNISPLSHYQQTMHDFNNIWDIFLLGLQINFAKAKRIGGWGYCTLHLFTRHFLSLIDLFSYHRQNLWSSSLFYHYTSHPLDSQIKNKKNMQQNESSTQSAFLAKSR